MSTSSSSRCTRGVRSHARLMIVRGYTENGLACRPWLRRSSRSPAVDSTVKSSPNFSAISSRLIVSGAGHTTIIRRARWRSSISCATRPASMVLPRPTSSAISRLTRGIANARATGSNW